MKSYFDTITHEKLRPLAEEKISEGKVLELIRSFLTQGVMESHKSTFEPIDGWVRMRLRSLLRKRRKGQGVGRGQCVARLAPTLTVVLGLRSMETTERSEVCREDKMRGLAEISN